MELQLAEQQPGLGQQQVVKYELMIKQQMIVEQLSLPVLQQSYYNTSIF